ncbi:MAG: NAD-dependent deacetylase [Syntrophobacteraceae bacterium]
MDNYKRAAEVLQRSRHVVALTGAGISVESGIPDFRSEGGLWTKFDPEEFAHIQSFRANPGKIWKMLVELDRVLLEASPNPAHVALAELERRGILKSIITQNVDSLHQRAGSTNVIEFHGSNRTLRCDGCGKSCARESISLERLPPVCRCGSPLRPDVVFFGENIPQDAYRQATSEATRCDAMLIVGTSAVVAPASYFPFMAKERGAFLIEINPSRTELSSGMADLHIAEPAGKALPAIIEVLGEISSTRGQ